MRRDVMSSFYLSYAYWIWQCPATFFVFFRLALCVSVELDVTCELFGAHNCKPKPYKSLWSDTVSNLVWIAIDMGVRTAKAIISALLFSFVFSEVQSFSLTLLHTNDNHGRFEETDTYGFLCYPRDAKAGKCFGGMARRSTMLKRIRAQEKNVLLVSGGDVFTGTLWYQVYRGNATSRFMNELGYDAVVCDISKFVLACVQKSAIASRMLIRPCLVKSCLKNELSAFRLQLWRIIKC